MEDLAAFSKRLLYDAAGPAGVAVCVIVLEAAALVLFVKLNARAKAL